MTSVKAAHKLLFFIGNEAPTDEEMKQAKDFMYKFDADVKFRNGDVPSNGKPEAADYVFGKVPEDYVGHKRINEAGDIEEARQNSFPSTAPASNQGGDTATGLAAEIGSVGGWGTAAFPQT